MIKKTLITILILAALIGAYEYFSSSKFKTLTRSYLNNMSLKDQIIEQKANIPELLKKEAPNMHPDVIDKVQRAMNCIDKNQIQHQKILTVIDYSLPSSQKRLWIFDLNQKRILYHTYVSHGLNSGKNYTTYFSNENNSRASSIGIYQTLQHYLGREGSSLRLKGLEPGYNNNAEGRAIVMHGAFYTEENFIKKYGRAGRSWGCPALPASQTKEIVNTIKNDNIMVVYYPSEKWLAKSPYLSCEQFNPIPVAQASLKDPSLPKRLNQKRDEVLFLSGLSKHFGGETPPILAVSADYYQQRINAKVPLERMLRRQIAHQEYVALSTKELKQLAANYTQQDLQNLYFIVPTLKLNHGYVQTVMKPIHLGNITEIHAEQGFYLKINHNQNITLSPNSKFIRWLGL